VNVLALEFPPVSHLFEWPDIFFSGTAYAINKTVLIYMAAVVITGVIFTLAGRPKQSLVPAGIQHVAESGIDFIEESVVLQTIGPEGRKFMPFLTTMFFFIMFSNIFEVIPGIQFPANSRMAIPITLALVVWVIYNYVGIRSQGFFGYLKNSLFPPGVPVALYLIVTPIELVSTFVVRPFSLAIRLWANMVAGHLLLVTFAVLTQVLWSSTYIGAIRTLRHAGADDGLRDSGVGPAGLYLHDPDGCLHRRLDAPLPLIPSWRTRSLPTSSITKRVGHSGPDNTSNTGESKC
jgi:F0F1-type ATP synthase, subunit a